MLANKIIIETDEPRTLYPEGPLTIHEVRDQFRRDGNDPIIFLDDRGVARVSFVPLACPYAYPTEAFCN